MTWEQGRVGAVLQYSHCAHDIAKLGAGLGVQGARGAQQAHGRAGGTGVQVRGARAGARQGAAGARQGAGSAGRAGWPRLCTLCT